MTVESIAVAVVIATRGRPDSLERTLDSLVAAHDVRNVRRILVVENGSNVSAGVVDRFVGRIPVGLIQIPAEGKSLALNRALEALVDELVIWIDDDVIVDEGAILGYASGAERWGRGHFFGGIHRVEWVGEPSLTRRRFFVRSMTDSPDVREGIIDSDSSLFPFLGFNWAAWADDVRAHGGFDGRFGPGSTTGATGQETEAQLRLVRGGVSPVILPQCKVVHRVDAERASDRQQIKRRHRSGIEAGLLARDGHGRGFARLVAGQLSWLLREVAGVVWRPIDRERRFRLALKVSYIAGILRSVLVGRSRGSG